MLYRHAYRSSVMSDGAARIEARFILNPHVSARSFPVEIQLLLLDQLH